jgi:pSer/pThr/pTyr-binding forkhead associated (FHA) protein
MHDEGRPAPEDQAGPADQADQADQQEPVLPDTLSLDSAAAPTPGGPPPDPSFVELTGEDADTVRALPAGSALLVLQAEAGSAQRFLLATDSISVGRHRRSEIFLDDATVSRAHAVFVRQGGRFVVRDVGSLNGTYVNHLRVDEAVLSAGDVVQVGKFRLVFHPSPADGIPPRT